MAIVYLAHDLRHHRSVAIKVLKPQLSAALGVERFLSEIKVTANFQHPNLLPLFDSGEADGRPSQAANARMIVVYNWRKELASVVSSAQR